MELGQKLPSMPEEKEGRKYCKRVPIKSLAGFKMDHDKIHFEPI
jgi:hypothetical protein